MPQPQQVGALMPTSLNNRETSLSPVTSPTNSLALACQRRYRNGINFLTLFNPSNQLAYTSDERRCYTGEAPSLGIVRKAFGDEVAETWVEIQLKDLSEYAGCRDKLSDSQIETIAQIILFEFGYMTVTQLMHFFLQFKAGRYGRFYGAVDGLVITEALQQYKRERFETLRRYESERKGELKSAEEAEHDAKAADFADFLAELHLSIDDYRTFCEWGITDRDEITELYWMVRL